MHASRRPRRQSSPPHHRAIDIRVTQPTPRGSPCGSERTLHDSPQPDSLRPRLAPLASISSCNSSIAADYPDLDSDDVFDEEEDTDDGVAGLSSDSDEEEACCERRELPRINVSGSTRSVLAEFALADRGSEGQRGRLELDKCSWSQETLF